MVYTILKFLIPFGFKNQHVNAVQFYVLTVNFLQTKTFSLVGWPLWPAPWSRNTVFRGDKLTKYSANFKNLKLFKWDDYPWSDGGLKSIIYLLLTKKVWISSILGLLRISSFWKVPKLDFHLSNFYKSGIPNFIFPEFLYCQFLYSLDRSSDFTIA